MVPPRRPQGQRAGRRVPFECSVAELGGDVVVAGAEEDVGRAGGAVADGDVSISYGRAALSSRRVMARALLASAS